MVIQRWQSLLLLVAAAVMGCFTFCTIGEVQTTDFTFNFTALGFQQEGIPTDGESDIMIHTWYFFALSLTTTLLLLIDIFLYNNLPLQKKVCLISVLFVIATGAAGLFLGCKGIENSEISWTAVVICPLLALAGAIMAYTCICRDHNRLKSVDRIR